MFTHQNARSTTSLKNVDHELRRKIHEVSRKNDNHWDYKGSNRSEFEQSPFQYPAMMVPALQRDLVTMIIELQPEISIIADPFVGSGTVLCEAMLAGKEFIGQDINPLAILLSTMRSKSPGPLPIEEARHRIVLAAMTDKSSDYAVKFRGQEKWFNEEVSITAC